MNTCLSSTFVSYYSRDSKNSNDEQCPSPSLDEIPAISAVIHNAALFRALVRCLRTASANGEMATETVQANVLGRKRSLSMTGESSMAMATAASAIKSAKTGMHHLSPVPARGKVIARGGAFPKPSFDVHVFAATCLYTAFQHLDHWPVQLVRAYAEDCFGPRLWVDHPQCAALVQNLALVHTNEVTAGDDGVLLKDAASVAEAYAMFEQTEEITNSDHGEISPKLVSTEEPFSLGKASDAANTAASDFNRHHSSLSSASFESSGSRNGLNRAKQRPKGSNNGSGKSDSGGECELTHSASDSSMKKQDDGNSSSSGEDDGNAVVMSKSEDSSLLPGKKSSNGKESDGSRSNGVGGKALYPISQDRLDQSRIRQRFFGENLVAAHAAIVSTLSERVDVKSKQNSNLLQCLPSFTPIPGVRYQIAVNLEKWLQSPALAGLARTLFTSTVNSMKNADPPLDEDLKAIDSIIAMRLKANQVSLC